MAIELNGKTYRNLPEQVEKNATDIAALQSKGVTVDLTPVTTRLTAVEKHADDLDGVMPTDISFDTSAGSFALRHDGTEITGQDTKANIKGYVEGVATAIVNAAGKPAPSFSYGNNTYYPAYLDTFGDYYAASTYSISTMNSNYGQLLTLIDTRVYKTSEGNVGATDYSSTIGLSSNAPSIIELSNGSNHCWIQVWRYYLKISNSLTITRLTSLLANKAALATGYFCCVKGEGGKLVGYQSDGTTVEIGSDWSVSVTKGGYLDE